MKILAEDAVIVVIDEQPTFLAAIHEAERVVHRTQFLLEAAKLLGIPVLATEQYPERMGGTHEAIAPLVSQPIVPKMAFSAAGAEAFVAQLEATQRNQVVLVGIESHICVTQTAVDLLGAEYDVFMAEDAISARSAGMHAVAMQRLRDIGAVITHTESVVYEAMGGADHAAFRDVLGLVKRFAG